MRERKRASDTAGEGQGGLFVDGVVAACTHSHAPVLIIRSWQSDT